MTKATHQGHNKIGNINVSVQQGAATKMHGLALHSTNGVELLKTFAHSKLLCYSVQFQ